MKVHFPLFVTLSCLAVACSGIKTDPEQEAGAPLTLAQILCPDISYEMEPEGRFEEHELTPERAAESIKVLSETIPNWIQNGYEIRLQSEQPDPNILDWETQMAWNNHLKFIELYILKLEAHAAHAEDRNAKVKVFCDTLAQGGRWD